MVESPSEGVVTSERIELESEWDFASFVSQLDDHQIHEPRTRSALCPGPLTKRTENENAENAVLGPCTPSDAAPFVR